MGIGSILSGVGAIAGLAGGAMGNKQKSAPVRTMEQSLGDIEKLREYLAQNTQYIPRPTRRLTAPELEGDFAPVAVREIQNYFDSKYPAQGGATAESAPVADPANTFTPQDEVFIKQYETGMIPSHQFKQQYLDAIKRRDEAGKVPLPMGGYAPSNAPQQKTINPLSGSELEQIRQILSRGM